MNLNFRFTIFILVFVTFFSGCSSIISGNTQRVTFQSIPTGATVNINGLPYGITPMTTMLERKNGQTMKVSKSGYKTYIASMETTVNPSFWGNLIFAEGSISGSTVDGISGAMYAYAPSQFLVTLELEGTTKVEVSTQQSKKDKALEFVIVNYHQINSDLSKGSGSYLSSLFAILEIPKYMVDSSIKRLKTLSEDYPDIAQFAEQVTNAFLNP